MNLDLPGLNNICEWLSLIESTKKKRVLLHTAGYHLMKCILPFRKALNDK